MLALGFNDGTDCLFLGRGEGLERVFMLAATAGSWKTRAKGPLFVLTDAQHEISELAWRVLL